MLGLPIAERGETNGLFITTKWEDAGEGYDIIVHDGLVKDGPSWTNYLVTRPCYLALRRAVSEVQIGYAGIIALMEPSRALSEKDVANALGNEVVATVSVHPVVARAIDAGLLPMRAMEQHKEVRLLALSHLRERQLLI